MGNREDAILLASYNGEKYIAEQIESLLAQTEAEWELFVHDDGSADRTLEVLRCYEAWYPDRIHVLDGLPCGGAKNNFLRMMRDVQAPYVMFWTLVPGTMNEKCLVYEQNMNMC